MNTDLYIPDTATRWLAEAFMACPFNGLEDGPDYRRWATKIAAPVVAVELRRLFNEIVTAWDAGDLSSTLDGFRMLTDRALELDGGAE